MKKWSNSYYENNRGKCLEYGHKYYKKNRDKLKKKRNPKKYFKDTLMELLKKS